MKVVVTGGCGFIGHNLVKYLISIGTDVYVIDNFTSPSVVEYRHVSGAKYTDRCITKDVSDFLSGAYCVFHLAAQSKIQHTILNPEKCYHTNVLGTLNLLKQSTEAGVERFVNASTSSIYGLVNNPPHKECMLPNFLNPYSESKYLAEAMCSDFFINRGLPTVSLRYFNVYGPGEPRWGTYSQVIGKFLEKKKQNVPLTIVGDGEQRRDFTHVSDIVKATANMGLLPGVSLNGQVVNVGTGTNYSVNEIADMISDNVVYVPERPGEARETLADTSILYSMLGWRPASRVEEYLNSFV